MRQGGLRSQRRHANRRDVVAVPRERRVRYHVVMRSLLTGLLLALTLAACNDGTEADRLGVGAQCAGNDDCDADTQQVCLLNFSGGYCGMQGCVHDSDCPEASACIAHTDGVNYCFRICVDKVECNRNRDLANEANCSASATFVDGTLGRKACVPPSGI